MTRGEREQRTRRLKEELHAGIEFLETAGERYTFTVVRREPASCDAKSVSCITKLSVCLTAVSNCIAQPGIAVM